MATLFAPLLIADAGQTPGKSFFYSFFGILRSFFPCLLAGLLLIGLTAVIAFIGNGLFLALGLGPGKSFFYSFFGILRSFFPCLLAGLLLIGLTAVIAFIGNGLFLALGLGGGFSYLSPFVVIFMTSLAQAMVWPMYRDLFGEKALFDRLP